MVSCDIPLPLVALVARKVACIAEGNQTPSCVLSLKSSAAAAEIKTKAKNELGIQTCRAKTAAAKPVHQQCLGN